MVSRIRGSDNFDSTGGNAVKAWVNFNGTGTVAIRAAFNVSSITDRGIGQYTVNFTTAMSDADYAVVGTAGTPTTGGESISPISYNTASCQVDVTVNASQVDRALLNVAIFR